MKPYYEDDFVTLYHGDWRDVLVGGCDHAACELPAHDRPFCAFHNEHDDAALGNPPLAVVTDPPYGVAYKPGGQASGKGRNGAAKRRLTEGVRGDDEPFDPTPFLRFPEVVLWGANHYADRLPTATRWLVWDKRKGTTSDSHADCEMAWTNLSGPARLWSQLWRGMIREGEHNSTPRVHPTQKPEALMRWCVGFTTGAVIFDPFAGSGTTLVAARQESRRAIGVEIEERYCEAAALRIAATPLTLEAA